LKLPKLLTEKTLVEGCIKGFVDALAFKHSTIANNTVTFVFMCIGFGNKVQINLSGKIVKALVL
jgi:hypothetical protein